MFFDTKSDGMAVFAVKKGLKNAVKTEFGVKVIITSMHVGMTRNWGDLSVRIR